jgi:hypothetical protein
LSNLLTLLFLMIERLLMLIAISHLLTIDYQRLMTVCPITCLWLTGWHVLCWLMGSTQIRSRAKDDVER